MFDITKVRAAGGRDLLTPENSVMLFVDHQPQMFFGVGSGDRAAIINSTVGLAKAARAFDVPAVLTTVAAASFSGPLLPQLAAVFPEQGAIDRTSVNAWEDEALVEAVKATGRKKVILSGLWTEVCLVLPALSMGSGEVTRYLGTYGSERIAKAVMIGVVPPFLLKTEDNPGGVDAGVFRGIEEAIRADRFAFLTAFLADFYNVDVLGGERISEEAVRASWNVAAGASAKGTLDCVQAWLTDFRADCPASTSPP
ncbi:isochorismatase family protein [Streptomyces sp. H27-G5]|uniref:isochorismatase family protein n=1 Tax=Streptomyces sp. H27-G5 TaxID=2996698 RepID=UPI0022717916|nr:isochorismatase family protein [Streptomyces sp. H27-G5]MCY0918419.1 isochorismatase family protein [Streptomyces sp. H27-G5]